MTRGKVLRPEDAEREKLNAADINAYTQVLNTLQDACHHRESVPKDTRNVPSLMVATRFHGSKSKLVISMAREYKRDSLPLRDGAQYPLPPGNPVKNAPKSLPPGWQLLTGGERLTVYSECYGLKLESRLYTPGELRALRGEIRVL